MSNTKKRFGAPVLAQAPRLLTVLGLGAALAACTSQETKSDGGAGQTGAGGGGGTPGAGGGSGTGVSDGVLCFPPAQAITDFTYDADAGGTDQVRFGTFGTTLSGGESAYGSLTSSVIGNDWHLSAPMIADYSGFNLYFDDVNNCNKVDASGFKGISFTIWGSIGDTMLTLGVSTLEDAVSYGWLASQDAGTGKVVPGRCVPTATGNQYYHPGCADPTYKFAVTGTQAAPQTVTVKWSDFTGGAPTASVTPTGILSVYWNAAWMPPTTPYPFDIHIDNLAFIP